MSSESTPEPLTDDRLRARGAELDAEMADTIAGEFGIQGLAIEDGKSTLTTKPTTERARQLVLAMSLACGRMLDDDQAPNYVEFEVLPAGQPGYIVHVRRAVGPSPHTLRREAEARADALEEELDEARARIAKLEAAQPIFGGYVVAVDSSTGREIVRDAGYPEPLADEGAAREALAVQRHNHLIAPAENYRLFALHEVNADEPRCGECGGSDPGDSGLCSGCMQVVFLGPEMPTDGGEFEYGDEPDYEGSAGA